MAGSPPLKCSAVICAWQLKQDVVDAGLLLLSCSSRMPVMCQWWGYEREKKLKLMMWSFGFVSISLVSLLELIFLLLLFLINPLCCSCDVLYLSSQSCTCHPSDHPTNANGIFQNSLFIFGCPLSSRHFFWITSALHLNKQGIHYFFRAPSWTNCLWQSQAVVGQEGLC